MDEEPKTSALQYNTVEYKGLKSQKNGEISTVCIKRENAINMNKR